MTAAAAPLVVESLDEVPAPRDGQQALVLVVSEHRDGQVTFERWVRVSGRWVPDAR